MIQLSAENINRTSPYQVEAIDELSVSFVTDNDELYETSMTLERKVNELEELFGSSKTNLSVGTLAVYKAEGKMNEYYDVVGNITQQLKSEYRDLVKGKVG